MNNDFIFILKKIELTFFKKFNNSRKYDKPFISILVIVILVII